MRCPNDDTYRSNRNDVPFNDVPFHKKPDYRRHRTGIVAIVLILLVLASCYFTIHVWTEETCERASECIICGKTETKAKGHQWSDTTCTEASVCRVCGETGAAPIGHTWSNATCIEPESCSHCGAIKGIALGHSWQSATCSTPEQCSICQEIRGTTLDHQWIEANFERPMTCAVCGAAEGMPLSYDSILVEEEVLNIRKKYNEIHDNRDAGLYKKTSLRSGVTALYDNEGRLVCATVSRGVSGLGKISKNYSRSYYFSEGKLIFAFYDGDDDHRLYFYQEKMIRWRYSEFGAATEKPINHDLTFSEEYKNMESIALEEVKSFR